MEVGEAGEPDLKGLVDDGEVCDELLPFESVWASLCCSEIVVTGALYVQTILSLLLVDEQTLFVDPESGLVSKRVLRELVTSSSISISTALIFFVSCSWSSERLVLTNELLKVEVEDLACSLTGDGFESRLLALTGDVLAEFEPPDLQ